MICVARGTERAPPTLVCLFDWLMISEMRELFNGSGDVGLWRRKPFEMVSGHCRGGRLGYIHLKGIGMSFLALTIQCMHAVQWTGMTVAGFVRTAIKCKCMSFGMHLESH
jgi:hypothetical protein